MKCRFKVVLLIVVLMQILVVGTMEGAPTGAFKNGDVIKIVVPFVAGGGYDAVARLMQPYYEKEVEALTGADVSIIVQNITGAGGVNGYTAIYGAKPDGKTIGIVGLSAAPYLQLTAGGFDLGKYTYLGQINYDPTALVVSKNSSINSFDDFINRSHQESVLLGTGGKGASDHMDPIMTQIVLKEHGIELNLDFVHYTGTADILLGIQKGEVEGVLITESTAYQHVRNGDMKGITIYSSERGQFLSNAKTLLEEKVPGAEKLIEIIGMSRVMAGPPGLSPEVASVLEKAMLNALHNSEFLKQAKDANLRIDATDAATAAQISHARLAIALENEPAVREAFK